MVPATVQTGHARTGRLWLRGIAFALALPACAAQATPALTLSAFDVLFGVQSYDVIGSPRLTLPWQITGIQAVFSEPVAQGNVNSLSGSGIMPSSFSGLGTNTLTWHFSQALADGSYAALLEGTGPNVLQDAMGNALQGGSDVIESFKVLAGDFNGDGMVDGADIAGIVAAESQPYNLFADLNGDGVVNAADVALVSVPASIPEPATVFLLGVGLIGLLVPKLTARVRALRLAHRRIHDMDSTYR